jgi:hypothetical protein
MTKKFCLVLVLVCLLIAPHSAMAWNETGHKVVARIAWDNLKPETRDKVMALLLYAPEDSGIGLLNFYDSRQLPYKQRDWFAMLSTWPDIVKDRNAPVRGAKYGHGGWHYTNFFWREVNGVPTDATDMTTPAENIVERLNFLVKALNDPVTPPADRAVYLVWVMHLIGDIQQPLHNSARVTELEPQGDQGGNLFELTPKDTPRDQRKGLHAYWDDILNINYKRETQDADQPFIGMLTARIEKAHPARKFTDRIKPGQFDAWSREGLAAAKTIVYPSTLKRYEWPSKQYQKTADRYAEEAIALGGYRLAQTIETAFANQPIMPLPPALQPRQPAAQPTPKPGP